MSVSRGWYGCAAGYLGRLVELRVDEQDFDECCGGCDVRAENAANGRVGELSDCPSEMCEAAWYDVALGDGADVKGYIARAVADDRVADAEFDVFGLGLDSAAPYERGADVVADDGCAVVRRDVGEVLVLLVA